MKIGDEVYVHGYVDEIRNGTIIIRNEGGYFGTAPDEVMPTAQTIEERKTGAWERQVLGTSGYGITVMYQCSECEIMSISKYRFCPYCGSRMEA